MSKFEIEEQYLTDVTVHYGYTDDNGVEIKTTSSIDHPSFDALRSHLGYRNFIKIQSQWVNGDEVLKDFTLNNKPFREGDKFSCASAMKIHLKYLKTID